MSGGRPGRVVRLPQVTRFGIVRSGRSPAFLCVLISPAPVVRISDPIHSRGCVAPLGLPHPGLSPGRPVGAFESVMIQSDMRLSRAGDSAGRGLLRAW